MNRGRFVILTHDHPCLHWDLMLERDGALRTWRLLREPAERGTSPAERLADHRLAYLDYEGPVSGGRGSVKRWDAGTYEVVAESEDELRIALHGTRLNGPGTLTTAPPGAVWSFVPGKADGPEARPANAS